VSRTPPKWGCGLYHGQPPRRVTSDKHSEGFGVFEQLIIGSHTPMGLKEFMDLG